MAEKDCGCNKPNNCDCYQSNLCGCKSKVDLLCTFYSGEFLSPLLIENGMDGNTIIKIINDYIQQILSDIELQDVVIESVGEGALIYKGFSSELKHEIKTALQGEGIEITEQENTFTISLDADFVTGLINVRNIGTGEDIYNGKNPVDGFQEFKRIKSNDNSIEVTTDDNTINVEGLVIDGVSTANNGIATYAGLEDKKIKLRPVKAGEGIRVTLEDDSIVISSPTGSSSSSDWYLDTGYIRPVGWQPAEPAITTVLIEGQSPVTVTDIPEGTLSDPFTTYEQFLAKYIGNTSAGYSRVNPRAGGKRLQILSNVNTNSDVLANKMGLFLNNVTFNYTGTKLYAYSQAQLWDMMPIVGGKLQTSIYIEFGGEGEFTRSEVGGVPYFGLLDVKVNETLTNAISNSFVVFSPTGKGFVFDEADNPSIYHNLTNADGITPLMNGNGVVMGTTQAPITPLIRINGRPSGWWSIHGQGTKVMVVTKSQKGIELTNGANLTSSHDAFKVQVSTSYIAYNKKLYTGMTPAPTADELELINDRNGLYFQPHDEYAMFNATGVSPNDAQAFSKFRIENLKTEPNTFIRAGWDSLVLLKNGGIFYNLVSVSDAGGSSSTNLVRMVGSGNTAEFNNGVFYSPYDYFIKGDGSNTANIVFKNASIGSVFHLQKDVSTLNINTDGMMSSIQGNPIISMRDFSNETLALAAGLVKGMLWRDNTATVTEDSVKQIN